MELQDRPCPKTAPDFEGPSPDEAPNWEAIWIDLGGEG